MTWQLSDYACEGVDRMLTPALLVYPAYVDQNIRATIHAMNNDPNRWRPHLKTAKMPWVIRRLLEHGVAHFKCATTRELVVACENGARDVLLAYPVVGANARRVAAIAAAHPDVRVSVLVENAPQVESWLGSQVGVFVDVNPGMDRTGIGAAQTGEIARIACRAGSQFRGIHFYDGHVSAPDREERERQAHEGYGRLFELVDEVEKRGVPVPEVITSGTPAFPFSLTFRGFDGSRFVHRASPGTVLFNDMTSVAQLPPEFGYRPAALVLATVVSHPLPRRVTCDGGHKSVSADAGVPTCAVIGRPELEPGKPSEEHLPIDVPSGSRVPLIGDSLYLLPRHVCPTVNQFDDALLVVDGKAEAVESVAARGHERALV